MKTKTTIITLAALSLGIAATQAGASGVIVNVPGAGSQHQHANNVTLTFTPKTSATSDIWCYKCKGYTITLTTPDNKQQKGKIMGRFGTSDTFRTSDPFIAIDKPEQRQVTNLSVKFGAVKLLSGKDLKIVFDFTNAAALTGTINLGVDVYPSAPKGAALGGKIEGPVYALADAQPVITWSLNPTFGKE
jgi:hypothetical protein